MRWLTSDRITLLDQSIADCAEPDLPQKLAANGYTHLIVRRGIPDSLRFDDHAPPGGLRVAARFPDGRVFAVTESAPVVYTAAMTGFYAREHDGARSWRWMGADAAWTVVNTGGHPVAATLCLEVEAFRHARDLQVLLDGRQRADAGRRSAAAGLPARAHDDRPRRSPARLSRRRRAASGRRRGRPRRPPPAVVRARPVDVDGGGERSVRRRSRRLT